MENHKWKTIEPNVWQYETEGDNIEGVLIQKRTEIGANKSNAYYLEKDGKQIMVWGSTVLDSRLDFINVGDYIRITYKGDQKNTRGQRVKIFKVEKLEK